MAFGYRELTAEESAEVLQPVVPAAELSHDQRAFLIAYSLVGTVKGASKRSKIHHFYHYEWKRNDEQYQAAFARIEDILVDHCVDKVKKRGVDGWNEPLTYKGRRTGSSIRRYSDQLALAYIRSKRPEWRDSFSIQQAIAPTAVSITLSHQSPLPDNSLNKLGDTVAEAKIIKPIPDNDDK